MLRRRDLLKLGLTAGGASALACATHPPVGSKDLLKFLCPPDGEPPDLGKPSPKARPFVQKLYVPPILQPVAVLTPPPDPRAHQRYEEFLPKKLYELHEQELNWIYHREPPHGDGSASWGFNGATSGPVIHARYGEPVLMRRINNLPPTGEGKVLFVLPDRTATGRG